MNMSEPIIIPCASESEWHERRLEAIGASEVAALIPEAEHPYLTPRQLWVRKKERLADTQQETERMEAGKFAELMCAPWYAKRTGRRVLTPQEFYANSHGPYRATPPHDWKDVSDAFAVIVRHPTLPLQCTPDRIVADVSPVMLNVVDGQRRTLLEKFGEVSPTRRGHGSLQLKNADRWLLDRWEDEGEATAPLAFQVQTAAEMMCCGFSWGSLAAVVGGNRLRYVDLERDEEFERKLAGIVTRFWASLQGDLAPAPVAGDLETIKKAFPESMPGLACEYPHPEDILELARVKAEAARLEEDEKALLAKIGSVVGPAETLTHRGNKVATWKTSEYHDAPREAKVRRVRVFRLDSQLLKQAKAALPAHEHRTPILPAG